jgi:hypothetical protein
VRRAERDAAVARLGTHASQQRPRERDNVFATRAVATPTLPAPAWRDVGTRACSPMAAIDETFLAIVQANPQLRPRVGNPDEIAPRFGRSRYRVNAARSA